MSLTFSTGARNYILGTGSFKGCFTNAFIDVFAGAKPASADTAPGSSALMTYSVNRDGVTGFTWGTASGGTINKASAETVQAIGLIAGTAGWFRMRLAGDAGTTNTTDRRVDGSIAVSGSDMDMANLSVTVGAIRTLDSFPIDLAAND